jgi:hypothetical protein
MEALMGTQRTCIPFHKHMKRQEIDKIDFSENQMHSLKNKGVIILNSELIREH